MIVIWHNVFSAFTVPYSYVCHLLRTSTVQMMTGHHMAVLHPLSALIEEFKSANSAIFGWDQLGPQSVFLYTCDCCLRAAKPTVRYRTSMLRAAAAVAVRLQYRMRS